MVSTWRRRLLWLFLFVVLLAAAGLYSLYTAACKVPEFYASARDIPPTMAAQASDQFSDQAFALANDVEKEGDWRALFTDEQINGWLATDLVTKHPELLPPGFENPRVKLNEDHGLIGVLYRAGGVETVAWIEAEARMTETNDIALRFRNIRAGALPLPLGTILDAISRAADDLDLPLRWTSVDDDPQAIIGLPRSLKNGLHLQLNKLKVSDGQLFLSGKTRKGRPDAAARETQ